MLDTLINSAEDVAQPGCVWHAEVIKESMKSLINYHDDSHQVSECLLEHRFKQIVDDGATMFGFVELYKALLDGDLQFGELGLLEDPAILNWSGKQEQINERLDKNKKLYEKLDFITHHFPNELDEKLAEINFSEKFISKNFGGDKPERWRTELELGDCFQEQAKNLNNSLELETETLKQGELISRNKSESKTGMRDRQLILLLEPEQTDFNLELSFLGGSVDKKQCVIQHNKVDDISVSTRDGDKRSKVKVLGQFNQQPLYFSLILKREKTAERFKFRVLVLPANEFYIDSFRHSYLIEPNKNRITLQTEDNSFVIAEQGNKAKLEEVGDVFETESTSEIDFEQVANESDRLHFIVKSNSSSLTFNVEGAIATDSLTLPLLLDQDRFVRLYQNDYFGTFKRAEGKLSKIILDNKEVAPKGRRLTLLQWEAELVDNQLLTRKDDETACVYLQNIEGDYPELYLAYRNVFDFCVEHKTLPSILGWGSNFRALVSDVVTTYLQAIEEIGIDIMLSKAQKRLVNIGFANYNDEELLTPFHPLNLAYYLNLANNIVADEDGSFKGLPKVTISRLNAQGLLPFVYHPVHGFSYNQLEKDNCFWLKLVPQQNTSYAYVRKLVKEKVGEFKDAFSALFNAGARSTLIINSVNNQKNHELFLGLVDYVKSQKDKVCQIHVNLYDDKLSFTEFDKFAETASYDEIKALYELDKGAIREQADAIIDLLRTRLTYSKFENRKTTEQAYAHLSFFRNNNKVEPTDVNVAEELSGVVCHGLLAGEAAANKEESYFTGFGLKGVDTKSLPHLRVAKSLASLIKPSRKSNEQHSLSKSMALAVSDSFKTLLERSYQSSIWTTIIDPKVTLDFFENATDLVLIHYSDNYTNSVNYDAITVSKQTELYKKVLEQDEGGITEEFNAFNGEWLLKMIKADGDARKNENDRKEKKGIIGAYKFVNCLLAKSDITWVPLSVAEMIRVAGNIGLKMSDSDFSRNVQGYKSGVISDDVLFVGFKDQQMYLLPLEVKTGIKQTHNKGVQQAKELKRYLTEDILGRQDFAGGLYRGLFIRQVLMQVDKYKLYNLYQDGYFTDFTNQREWWLQGDYSLAEINNYPEGFLVSHVENDTFFEAEFTEVENILKIQLPISYLRGFVSTPLQELMHEVCPEKLCHIPQKYILMPNADNHGVELVESVSTNKPSHEAIVVSPILPKIKSDTDVDVGHSSQHISEQPLAGEKVITLKPADIDDSDWEEILLFANELNQRKQIDVAETVKKQVGFYNEIRELRLKEPHEQLNQFESIIAEAEITSPSDYEKQYRFIKVQLDNRVTESSELLLPTGLPKDIAENIVKAAKEAYFDDKEMFEIFIKEQTEAFLAITMLKPTDMLGWAWDALLAHTEQKYIDDYSGQLTEIKKHITAYNDIENIKLPGARQELHQNKQEARELHPGDYYNQLKLILNEWKNLKAIDKEVTQQKQAKDELMALEFTGIISIEKEEVLDFVIETYPDDYVMQLRTAKSQLVMIQKIVSITSEEFSEELKDIKCDTDILYPGDFDSQYTDIKEKLAKLNSNAKSKLEGKPESSHQVKKNKPTDTLKVLIGHNVQNEQPILWEPTNTAKFMNTNSGIIGTMGTGKTQCTKSVVTQLYRNQHNNVDGKPIGILIFDYKSDYVDDKFIEATQGKKFNLHKLPYNPLSLFGDTPMLPVHTARGFSETMGRAFGLGQKQTLKLRKLIGEAYDLAGIKKADPSTWLKPAPTIADVWALFEESEPAEDSLYAALESLHELEIFETDITKCTSLYELVDGITVIELAGYPGEIQNLVVALTLDLFYSQMQKQGKPEVQGDFRQVTKLLLVDEADNFMSQNYPSLRKVLKEGREYGVGVILSTQDITHFKTSENDYSAYILSWIVHRVGQIKNQDIKSIFNKDDKADQEQLMKSIRELDKHYSLYVDGDKKVQKIKDKAFWELLNDD
jgi:DNA phosphorothioation-dependent restriction protein DptH